MPSNCKSRKLVIPVALECDEDSCSVVVPDCKGCFSGGDTPEEALTNAVEAITLWLEDAPIPELRGINYWRNSGEFPSDTWTWALVSVPKPDFLN